MELQVIEATPVSGASPGQTALIHCDVKTIQADGTRKHNQGLSYVMTAMTGVNQWMLYYSEICSPANTFNQNLPVLWEIWKSWKISNSVFKQRIDQALKSLNEANQIYEEAMSNHNQVIENSFQDWDEYIRGYRYLLDTDLDRLYEVNLHLARPMVEKLNELEGTDRYLEIPSRIYSTW